MLQRHFFTAYCCTDYCANTELSSTLARCLNLSRPSVEPKID